MISCLLPGRGTSPGSSLGSLSPLGLHFLIGKFLFVSFNVTFNHYALILGSFSHLLLSWFRNILFKLLFPISG